MSARLEPTPTVAPSHLSTAARAARLAKFKREQLIVDYLNRGVSVVEIAARVGLSEKRMRAIIREILARRMPHPPEEFVAIQFSRLNEALLVAFSAMSPTNLKAVDQVVKIVRELDRYGGAFAAEWARPKASHAEPGERSPAFGGALFCSAELGLQDHEAVPAESGRDERPENPAQHLEKIDSAPGDATLAAALSPGQGPGVDDTVDDRVHEPLGADACPQNPAQSLEKVESAPGIGSSFQAAEAAPAGPVSTPDLVLSLLSSAPGRQILRSRWSTLRAGTYGVVPQLGRDVPFDRPGRTRRPGKSSAKP